MTQRPSRAGVNSRPAGPFHLIVVSLAVGVIPVGAASITSLGHLPGGELFSEAHAVSDDGSVVVGFSGTGSGYEAFRWTQQTGMIGLGQMPGGTASTTTYGYAVSADGSVVAGYGIYPNNIQQAFRWTSAGGIVGLGFVGQGMQTRAFGMSADGSTVVGYADDGNRDQAVRWTASTGMQTLGAGGSGLAASADGGVVVGHTAETQPFRWTSSGGLTPLPIGGLGGAAFDVSRDGNIVVGFRGTGVQQPSDEAFRFTVGSGVIGLGHLPGGALSLSYAYGVSADGSVVVGRSNSQVGDQAFVWTPQTGMLALSDILIASGIDPAQDGWTVLTQASAVTPDGRFVAGFGDRNGHREGFLADLVAIPEPSSFLLLSLGSVLLCGRFKSRLAASQRQNVP